MSIRRFLEATAAAAVVLTLLNAVVFSLAFPGGLLENYVYPRPAPLIGYETAAIVATALLMTAIYVGAAPTIRGRRAAAFGFLLGLLASVPAQLSLFAVVRSAPWREAVLICWTAASWSIAGSTISWFLTRDAGGGAKGR